MNRMKVPLKSIEQAESAESLNKSLRLPVLAQLSGVFKIFFVSVTLPLLHFYAKFQLWHILPCVHFSTFI